MAGEIGGFGLQISLIASVTFPAGIILTQFADDADPLDSAAIQIADAAMGLNGDLVTWSKAVPIPMALNVIPQSDDDRNLAVLAEANRVGKGKRSVRDVITASIIYPDGTATIVSNGKLLTSMVMTSVSSSSRMKSKPYTFAFQNKTGG